MGHGLQGEVQETAKDVLKNVVVLGLINYFSISGDICRCIFMLPGGQWSALVSSR